MKTILSYFFTLFCYLVTYTSSYSQKIEHVIAEGKSITHNESREIAREQAINDAKKNALKNAGVIEEISLNSILLSEQSSNKFNQIFSEISSSEIKGAIIVDSVIYEKREINEYDFVIFEVKIVATVYKYNTEKDPSFTFNIDGIKSVYYSSDYLTFKFTPYQDGYLKVFNYTENEDTIIQLYPYFYPENKYLSDIPNQLFSRGEVLSFPIHPAFSKGYKVKIKKNKNSEMNYLLFVFLKEDIPCYNCNSLNNILTWIYSLDPSIRNEQYFAFKVINN